MLTVTAGKSKVGVAETVGVDVIVGVNVVVGTVVSVGVNVIVGAGVSVAGAIVAEGMATVDVGCCPAPGEHALASSATSKTIFNLISILRNKCHGPANLAGVMTIINYR